MKKLMLYALLSTFLISMFVSVVGWTPIGPRVQPAVRTLLEEIRDFIDPADYAVFTYDFFEDPPTTVFDTTSVVNDHGSSGAIVDSLNKPGVYKISPVAEKLNGMNIQTVNAPFRVNAAPANPDSETVFLEYEVLFYTTDATQCDISAGLLATDTNISTGFPAGFGFVKHDGVDSIYIKEADSNSSDSVYVADLADGTWIRLKAVWNGAGVNAYVDGQYKNRVSTSANQPTGVNLKPSFEVVEGDSTTSYTYLDYIWARQRR